MKTKTIIIFICIFISNALYAGPVNLDGAVEMAFKSNAAIHNAEFGIEAARSNALTQGTFLNPEASVEFTGSINAITPLTIEITQSFEPPGVLQLKSRIAGNWVSSSKLLLMQKIADVYEETVSAFYGVSLAGQKQLLAAENLEYMRRLRGSVEIAYNSGKARKNDLHRVKISVLEAEKEYLAAVNDFENEKGRLNIIMGREPDEALEISAAEPVLIQDGEMDGAIESFMADNPYVKQAVLELDSAEGNLWMEQLKRLPEITAGVSLQKENGADNYTGLLGINLPLWNLNQGEAGRAGAEYEAAKNNLSLVNKQVKLLSLILSREIKLASRRLEIAREEASSANEMIKLAQQSYMEGRLDLVGYYDQMKTAFESKARYYEEIRSATAAVCSAHKYTRAIKYIREKK